MKIDLEASDSTSAASRQEVDELCAWTRKQLGLNGSRPWKLMSFHLKMRKIFFEVEEAGPAGPQRMIGKVSLSERARGSHEVLKQLWERGLRPPQLYTVVRPVAWLPERHLLLQEKAPGIHILDAVRGKAANYETYLEGAAAWLSHLQRTELDAPTAAPNPDHLQRWRRELTELLPVMRLRICKVADAILAGYGVASEQPHVPSHGDFHPMNVFVETSGRVTVIDFDTFALREPMFDVAYFLGQTAIMGYIEHGSFRQTRVMRQCFLDTYRSIAASPLHVPRISVYLAATFLQSLHYDLCILKTANFELVEPWMSASERCLLGDSMDLS